jgi:hypothetical protein
LAAIIPVFSFSLQWFLRGLIPIALYKWAAQREMAWLGGVFFPVSAGEF